MQGCHQGKAVGGTNTHANTHTPWLHMPQGSSAKERCQGYKETGFLLAEESLSHMEKLNPARYIFALKTADMGCCGTKLKSLTAYLVDAAFDNMFNVSF